MSQYYNDWNERPDLMKVREEWIKTQREWIVKCDAEEFDYLLDKLKELREQRIVKNVEDD